MMSDASYPPGAPSATCSIRVARAEATVPLRIDELPDGVLVASTDGRIVAANAAFLELVDLELADVLGRPFEALVAEEDMVHLVGFQTLFSEHVTRDNHVAFMTAYGERRALLISAIRAQDERHVIMTARSAGTMQEALADGSRWAAEEQERSIELRRARDGLATKNDALSAAQAELQSAYATLQQETAKRERLEEELRLAQRLESIGQLAAGIAHEINTPMQYIGDNISFLSSAARGLADYVSRVEAAIAASADAELKAQVIKAQKATRSSFLLAEVPGALEASRDGVAHVSRIVQAMKSFAHQDQDAKVPTDINRTLQDTLIVAQNEYKRVATAHTELGELPSIACFPGKLNQVFLNLIVNAAHAIEDAHKPGMGQIRVASRTVDGGVEVRISDDGCGIPQEIAHRIFDPFFTTKAVGRGTGQGLSLARRIVVDMHGGSLSFESVAGAGTTFIVQLPSQPREPTAPGDAPAP
jgi:PAS domain S-box-containing protein